MPGFCQDQPQSLERGIKYYLQTRNGSGQICYQPVIFLAYRPHPAEVIVRDKDGPRKVYRGDIYLANREAEPKTSEKISKTQVPGLRFPQPADQAHRLCAPNKAT